MRDKKDVMRDLRQVRRRKITLQQEEERRNQFGDVIGRDWVDRHTLWATRSQLWGSDFYTALLAGQEQVAEFLVRYVPFLDAVDTSYRLVCGGQIFTIIQLDFFDDTKTWVKFRAKAWTP